MTFHPTFLSELIFAVSWAGMLIWIGHRWRIRRPGVFALYVTGYSAFRIFEESLRIDAQHFFGLRLNFFVASGLALVGLCWFVMMQFRQRAGDQPPFPDAILIEDETRSG